jgi:hypothetical protein
MFFSVTIFGILLTDLVTERLEIRNRSLKSRALLIDLWTDSMHNHDKGIFPNTRIGLR